MNKVKPKKHLGQHFLTDLSIAQDIAESLTHHRNYDKVLEIGPGTGALTQYLIQDDRFKTDVAEIDQESVAYLEEHYPSLTIHNGDILKLDWNQFGANIAISGNFPYNISSQILFKIYDHRDIVSEMCGMFQKEVAERVTEKPGSKKYGILSVLLQAFYHTEYLFTVDEHVFNPPPKVKSGVIRLIRNDVDTLPCDEKVFFKVVKTAFNQRRKMLRNNLKPLLQGQKLEHELLTKRPEHLSVEEFVEITQMIENL